MTKTEISSRRTTCEPSTTFRAFTNTLPTFNWLFPWLAQCSVNCPMPSYDSTHPGAILWAWNILSSVLYLLFCNLSGRAWPFSPWRTFVTIPLAASLLQNNFAPLSGAHFSLQYVQQTKSKQMYIFSNRKAHKHLYISCNFVSLEPKWKKKWLA